MTQDGAFSIEEVSGDLRDLRSLTPAHDLTEVLVVALCAILSSADSGVTIQTCAEAKLEHAFAPRVGRSGCNSRRQYGARRSVCVTWQRPTAMPRNWE